MNWPNGHLRQINKVLHLVAMYIVRFYLGNQTYLNNVSYQIARDQEGLMSHPHLHQDHHRLRPDGYY